MSNNKPTRFVFASDSHGDMACENSLKALYAYCKEYKPDIRIAGGDHFDLRSLRKGAMGDKEGAESLQFDLDSGFDFITKFRPTHLLKGNHEFRLEQMARNNPSGIVRDYCFEKDELINTIARKAGCKVVLPYHRMRGLLRIGPISCHHGIGSNLLKMGKHYTAGGVVGGAFICGHGHAGHQVNLDQHGGGAAYMSPCLARINDLEYAQNYLGTARWNNGFIAGWFSGNIWKAWIVHSLDDKCNNWIWHTDLKTWSVSK